MWGKVWAPPPMPARRTYDLFEQVPLTREYITDWEQRHATAGHPEVLAAAE